MHYRHFLVIRIMIAKQEQLIDRNDTQKYIIIICMVVKIHVPLPHIAIAYAYAYGNVMLPSSYLHYTSS